MRPARPVTPCFGRNKLVEPTDLLPRLNDAASAPRSMPMPMDAEIIELPPRTEDVIDLYKRFRRELDNLPRGAGSGPTSPRLKVLDELSFSELFRLTALWHDVKRLRPPDGDTANARHARYEERRWQDFTIGCKNVFRSVGRNGTGWSRLVGRSPTGACSVNTRQTGSSSLLPITRRAATTPQCGGAKGNPLALLRSSSPSPTPMTWKRWSSSPRSRACGSGSASGRRGTSLGGVLHRVGQSCKPIRVSARDTRSRRVDADNSRMEGRRARSRIGEGLDINSLTRAELTRLIELNDEGVGAVPGVRPSSPSVRPTPSLTPARSPLIKESDQWPRAANRDTATAITCPPTSLSSERPHSQFIATWGRGGAWWH